MAPVVGGGGPTLPQALGVTAVPTFAGIRIGAQAGIDLVLVIPAVATLTFSKGILVGVS